MDKTKTGAYIANKRDQKGLTQEELAEKVGVSVTTISNWETGKHEIRKRDNLINLAKALGVNVFEIQNGEDSELDAKTKAALDQVLLTVLDKFEDRILLALEMGIVAAGFAIVAIAMALGAMLPDTSLINAMLFLLAVFGFFFLFIGKRILRTKERLVKRLTDSAKKEHK